MKKFLLFLTVVLCFLTGCSKEVLTLKDVCILIPEHPWELSGQNSMWYSLIWSHDGVEKYLYVDTNTRQVHIQIPKDQTVVICAYPLDTLHPFGAFVTPLDSGIVTLDQNVGYLADIVLNGALNVTPNLNSTLLIEKAKTVTTDFRYIEESILLADILNGQLQSSSLRKTNPVEIRDLEVYSGTWISENCNDMFLDPSEVYLPVGVSRFYNVERNLEMRIVVNTDGTYSKFEERALVPSK